MVTWNLKEARGKLPVRGTQNSYMAKYKWVSLLEENNDSSVKFVQIKKSRWLVGGENYVLTLRGI